MIGLKDYSVLICNPSKCGTERLVRTLVPEFAYKVREKHGWSHVPGYEKYVLMVRDPLERWVSTYWWIKNSGTYQGYRAIIGPYMKCFGDFTKFIASRKSQSFVFNSLDEYHLRFDCTDVQKLEDLEDSWPGYLPQEAYQTYMGATAHKTRDRKSVEETLAGQTLSPQFLDIIRTEYLVLRDHYPKPVLIA